MLEEINKICPAATYDLRFELLTNTENVNVNEFKYFLGDETFDYYMSLSAGKEIKAGFEASINDVHGLFRKIPNVLILRFDNINKIESQRLKSR